MLTASLALRNKESGNRTGIKRWYSSLLQPFP